MANAWQAEVEIDLVKLNKELINTNLKDGNKFNRKNGGKTIILKLTGLTPDNEKFGNNIRVNQPGVKGTENERGDIVGNGRVFWTEDGTINVATREDKGGTAPAAPAVEEVEDDLPF